MYAKKYAIKIPIKNNTTVVIVANLNVKYKGNKKSLTENLNGKCFY